MKKCNGPCGLEKEDFEFNIKRYKSGHIGLRALCKACNHLARVEYRKSSPKDNERNKAYNRENAARIRGNKLRKYWPGSTWQEAAAKWGALFNTQRGECAICRRAGKRLAVDHHHGKGHVRGLLCNACNRALGYFQDSDEVLLAACDYVKKYK